MKAVPTLTILFLHANQNISKYNNISSKHKIISCMNYAKILTK